MKAINIKWIIGSVLVPSMLGVLTIFGMQLNDMLFPEMAPALDGGDIRHLEHKITAVEAKIELLTQLYVQNDTTVQPAAALDSRPILLTTPESQAQQVPQLQQPVTQPQPQTRAVSHARKFQPLIRVVNDSEYLGRKMNIGQREWDWTIYLSGPQEALGTVRCVTYRLHPMFQKSVQEVCRSPVDGKAFPLTAKGWGTFNINVTVSFDDESVFVVDHYLVLKLMGSE